MANPSYLSADTVLYSPMEPEGRQFCHGEPWPGDAWSATRGGKPVGANAAAGALKDLIEANDRLDQTNEILARKDHDLAVMAAERDEANGKVADLEQRAIAAEKAQTEAADAAKAYMLERDQARSEVKAAADRAEAAQADGEAKVAGLVEQLNAANQALADANTQIETLTAPKKAAKADPAPADAAPAS